jgi:flagellar protein FlaJ
LDLEEAIRQSGYGSIDEFFTRLVLPVLGVTILLFLVSLALINVYGAVIMPDLAGYLMGLPFIILVLGALLVIAYPYFIVERRKVDIHDNIHYFITYAGALSTIHARRSQLFRYAAERTEYGEIAKIMEKVAYLSDYWNLGLVKTCRRLSTLVPSKILGNFLDRMSAAFDFGERLDIFLRKEQSAVMEDYATEYRQTLQTMDLIQDTLVSMTIGVAFMMAVAFLLPLITGYSIFLMIGLSAICLYLIDIAAIIFIDAFITHDRICHSLPIKPPIYYRLRNLLLPCFLASIILLAVLTFLDMFSLPVNTAIAVTPLMVIGYLGGKMESTIMRNDQAFPAFIRSLGGSLAARGGSLVGTIGPLRVHEFGVLNEPVENMYNRLRIRCDKFKSWMYFAGETGSEMIEKFSSIFIQVVNLGGNPEKASEIISDNFIKLLSLRELRLQLASSVKGVYYGTLVGIGGASYATLRMVALLNDTFRNTFSSIVDMPSVSAITEGILPTIIGEIDIPLIQDILFIVLLVHAALCAYSIKMIDGGSKWSAFIDFVLMVWLLAFVAVVVPWGFEQLFQEGALTMTPLPV